MDKLDRIPEKIKDIIFEKVFKIAEYSKLNPDERVAYEDSLKYYRDLKNSLDKAFEDGQAALIPLLRQAEERVEQERKEKEQERKEKEQERKDRVDAEIKAQIANKKLNHIVLKQFNKGKTIQEIAEDLEIQEEEVEEIIASSK